MDVEKNGLSKNAWSTPRNCYFKFGKHDKTMHGLGYPIFKQSQIISNK